MTVVFLDASTPELVRRYDATRRKHPLAARGRRAGRVDRARARDAQPRPARPPTSSSTPPSSTCTSSRSGSSRRSPRPATSQMQVAVESFGFKHGLPLDADIVMDVRFLPNPHWDEQLRPLTGHDPAVRDYVIERAADVGVPRPVRRPAEAVAARLPGGGAQLPHDRHRLHRRPAPLGRHRRGARQPPARPRARRPHQPPRRRPAERRECGRRVGGALVRRAEISSAHVRVSTTSRPPTKGTFPP